MKKILAATLMTSQHWNMRGVWDLRGKCSMWPATWEPKVHKSAWRLSASVTTVTAIYGFSGGGYNARLIWKELTAAERERIRKVIVIGSPRVTEADFPGKSDILIRADPPEGHMAGPSVLLESVNP